MEEKNLQLGAFHNIFRSNWEIIHNHFIYLFFDLGNMIRILNPIITLLGIKYFNALSSLPWQLWWQEVE
jgi:hypothetical protein